VTAFMHDIATFNSQHGSLSVDVVHRAVERAAHELVRDIAQREVNDERRVAAEIKETMENLDFSFGTV